MEMQLFDTELNLSPVDVSQIPKEGEVKEVKEIIDDSNSEYTLIDVIDKQPKEKSEETEKVEEPKDKKEMPASEQSADSSKFPYSTFAKALYEEGVITEFDEKEFEAEGADPLEALFNSVQKTIREQRDSDFNRLTPQGKQFLEALEAGVPLDKFIQSKTQEYSYSSIKDETLKDNDDLCKKLIRDDLTLKGFDPAEIEDQITDFDSLGKLEAKAKTALKKLQAASAEQIKQDRIEAEKRNQEIIEANKKQLDTLKSEIEKVTEIIPGVKLNAKIKGELYDAITTPAEQMPNGQWVNEVYAERAKNPMDWDLKVAYLYKLGVFNNKWDKILGTAKSAATKELSDKLKGGNVSTTGDPAAPAETPKAKDILASMAKSFPKRGN